MMRTCWKGALLAVVASAGVAWGQPVLRPGGELPPAERTVTIQQKDGLPEPCRLLKTWTTTDGRSAHVLQSLDTDEMLTVVEKGGAKGSAAQVGVRIYRWGNATLPPEGSPAPPADGGIRKAAFTTEATPPHRAGDLPRLPPVTVTADLACAAPIAASTCSSGGCDKSHCGYVHHYEKPPSLHFVPGDCLPVCAPTHAPNYGYYQTQWHPFPTAEVP
jgi:hypothetical protein